VASGLALGGTWTLLGKRSLAPARGRDARRIVDIPERDAPARRAAAPVGETLAHEDLDPHGRVLHGVTEERVIVDVGEVARLDDAFLFLALGGRMVGIAGI
jgi:hypothetical protein